MLDFTGGRMLLGTVEKNADVEELRAYLFADLEQSASLGALCQH
jgi:hypothetical protein